MHNSVRTQPGKCAIFTICSNNYLAFAKTLLNSLAEHEPTIDRFLILADKFNAPADLYPSNSEVICVEDLKIPDFDQFAFRYDIMEFNTAIKPFAALALLQERGYDSVIYLDPDIEVFAPLKAVIYALEAGASVVLTPHVCHPAEGEVVPNDLQFLQAGTYNLGFCAWGKTTEALATLRWWARRLEHQCVNEVARGLFVDQKFIDLVPGFVDKAVILRDPSLNVAYWNLSQRDLQQASSSEGESWTVDGQPLTFFHFSGFAPTRLEALSKHTPMFAERAISPSLMALMQHYAKKLFRNGYGAVPAAAYPWGKLNDGTRIHPSVRKMFRERFADWKGDPFENFGPVLQNSVESGRNTKIAVRDTTSPVTAHMLYLRDSLNWLQFLFDLNTDEGSRGLANWYVDAVGSDWNLDDRLLAPVIERLSKKPVPIAPPSQGGGRSDISLIGYLRATSGVGQMARASLRTLATLPYTIEGHDIALRVGGARTNLEYQSLETEYVSGRVQIFNINADQVTDVIHHIGVARWEDAYKIAVPFWELDKFPAQFAEDLAEFDELWATSHHVHALLYRQFRDKPVYYMPPDLTPARPSNRTRASFGLVTGEFIVFFAFDFLSQVERKNPHGAYEAFRRAFPRGGTAKARFVLKTLNAQYAPPDYALWRDKLHDDPDVCVIDETLSHDDMLALIGCANVVLSLHRGEGLGLLIADAIGQIVPIVSTDWSGTTDLIDQNSGYPVSYQLVPTPPSAYPYVDGHRWAEPDLDHAAWQLQSVYQNPVLARKKARLARANLVMSFGPGRASSAMSQRLHEIFATEAKG